MAMSVRVFNRIRLAVVLAGLAASALAQADVSVIAHGGTNAPGTAVVFADSFGTPTIDDSGSVLFRAQLAGTSVTASTIEVADIFRTAGPAYRVAHAGHLSLSQLKVMSAIETCRTAALGGHVEACSDCGHRRIAYNSCRNRHCPRCQGAAARTWLEAQKANLLPVGYFHVVFTLPAEIGEIAFSNKALVYDLLFRAASQTMLTIAADPKHLGAKIGITAVHHTWGSAMTHHPHLHMIVPGGGVSRGEPGQPIED